MWRYRKPRFERLLLEELQRQQRGSMFCDTVLQAGGISVPAHSCVLSALSPQFAHALSAAPALHAGQNQLLEFQAVDARTLLKLVGFFYSGELDVEGEQEREEDIFPAIKRQKGQRRIHPVPCPPAPQQLINALTCDTLPVQQLVSMPQAPLLPSSSCPPHQTSDSVVLHTAPLSPAQVSPVRPISPASPVHPEEPVEQIEKLLEDILLGLNFFPPNSTVSQDSYPKSYLPSSTSGLDPAKPCGIQQEQELGVLESCQGDLSPTESSARAFANLSETGWMS